MGDLQKNNLNDKRTNFDDIIYNCFEKLKQDIKDKSILTNLILNNKVLAGVDTHLNKAPEDLTEQTIIEPILKFFGFEPPKSLHRRTSSLSKIECNEADYTLITNNVKILLESEPLNKKLDMKGSGINQVEKWLQNRAFDADYGIATNGFEWILLKYDIGDYKIKQFKNINLKPFFLKLMGQKVTENLDKLFYDFYEHFSKEYIFSSIRQKEIKLENKKESITKKFYDDYIRLIFGYDKRKKKNQYCLIDNITTPFDSTEEEKRLFSVIFMSRLVFIKFLEDKGIIEKNIFKKMYDKYNALPSPRSFYITYLQPLFYEVLNTNERKRKDHLKTMEFFSKIPYLNGGLFREVVRKEKDFDIENNIIELIINELIEEYYFTLGGEGLNPEILGLVFEKTINYLTGKTDRRKKLGAYYTPDDITTYISKESVCPLVLDIFKEFLRKEGWNERDVNLYENLDEMLKTPPTKNPKMLKNMITLMDAIKIIDPACGSGHFLTSVMKEMVRIKKNIYDFIGEDYNLWELKKGIINNNIYGVDIEESAVEIAKLRLWLSLIEDMNIDAKASQIETLPNIDYNIRAGNSLIGWTDEELVQNVTIETYPERIKGNFEGLKVAYFDEKEKYERLVVAENFLKKKEGNIVSNQKKAYQALKQIYLDEKTDKATILRDILETLRKSVYTAVNPTFLQYLRENSKRLRIENAELDGLKPFHWGIDFAEILENGGFDVIIANPPYGDLLKKEEMEIMKNWVTINCNEIALNFLEREIKLLGKDGYLSNIIAMSVFVNEQTISSVNLIRKNFSLSKVSFFGTRPAKIFKDAEIRVSIFIGKKDVPKDFGTIYTTDAIKFTRNQRLSLLSNLKFESSDGLFLSEKIGMKDEGILAKVGFDELRNILLKLKDVSKYKIIENLIVERGVSLEYRKTGGYWLTTLDKYPYSNSTKIAKLIFENEIFRDFVLLVLNSSLFYLFWSTYENLRDLKFGILKKFPIPEEGKIIKNKVEIAKLKEKLTKCLLKSFIKDKGRKGEFDVGICKNIIDEADDFICPLYDLSKEEIEFVKKYDSHIRKNKFVGKQLKE